MELSRRRGLRTAVTVKAVSATLEDQVKASGAGRATCARLELRDVLKGSTTQRLRDAFEAAKVSFVNNKEIAGVIVALEGENA